MRRGEIWIANMNPARGREVGKVRPSLVLQADWLTETGSATVVVLPLSSRSLEADSPLRVPIPARDRLREDSHVLVEQLRSVDRDRFGEGPLTTLDPLEMATIEKSLKGVLGLAV